MTVTLIALAAVVFVLLFYILVLIRTYPRPPHDERVLCDYAHRGLHGNGVPENSLAAFGLAAEKGYGIELDVRLSADGEVTVFHDSCLMRMTGNEGRVSDFTAAELAEMRLAGGNERIPRLSEVLELVGGRVPILIELKGENGDTELCKRLAETLSGYSGPYLFESFNPLLLRGMAKLMPLVYRGILYTNKFDGKKKFHPAYIIARLMVGNAIAKPNFVAYDKRCRRSLAVKLAAGLYGARRLVWTVKSADERITARKNNELSIFEGDGITENL